MKYWRLILGSVILGSLVFVISIIDGRYSTNINLASKLNHKSTESSLAECPDCIEQYGIRINYKIKQETGKEDGKPHLSIRLGNGFIQDSNNKTLLDSSLLLIEAPYVLDFNLIIILPELEPNTLPFHKTYTINSNCRYYLNLDKTLNHNKTRLVNFEIIGNVFIDGNVTLVGLVSSKTAESIVSGILIDESLGLITNKMIELIQDND